MRAGGLQKSKSCALAAVVLVAGCAAPSVYHGIDISGVLALPPACAEAEVQLCYSRLQLPHVARLAQSNDKHAQLELGIRFEEGVGVERNLGIAEELYLAAATDVGARATYFAPSSRKGDRGGVESTQTAVTIAGLPQAQSRLMQLRQRERGRCDAGC